MHSNAQNHERNKIALQRKSLLINGPGHWREEEEEYYYRASPELSPMQKGADDNIQQNRIIKLRTAEEQPSNSRRWETTVLNLGRAGKGSKEESLKLHTKSRQTGSKIYIYMFFLQRQELLVLRTCGFKLWLPWNKTAPDQTWRRQKLRRNITMKPVHRIYRLQIQMDSPPSRLSLFRPFSLSPSVSVYYSGSLKIKEGGVCVCVCVVPNKDNSRKKKGGLRKRQTTNQEEKPQNEILLATTKPHDTRSETAEERQQ
jgi:hypothetical protein